MSREDEINYLRMKRKQLKLRIQDVADYLNISKSAISQYECFKSTLSRATINKYHEFINGAYKDIIN